jgi:hypothetical protein
MKLSLILVILNEQDVNLSYILDGFLESWRRWKLMASMALHDHNFIKKHAAKDIEFQSYDDNEFHCSDLFELLYRLWMVLQMIMTLCFYSKILRIFGWNFWCKCHFVNLMDVALSFFCWTKFVSGSMSMTPMELFFFFPPCSIAWYILHIWIAWSVFLLSGNSFKINCPNVLNIVFYFQKLFLETICQTLF